LKQSMHDICQVPFSFAAHASDTNAVFHSASSSSC
jgi:hypothetical protein